MQKIQGCDFTTTREEALAIYSEIQEQVAEEALEGQKVIAAKKIVKPVCTKDGCETVCGYVSYTPKPKTARKMGPEWWLSITSTPKYWLHSKKKMFVPIQSCLRCGASTDGFRAGIRNELPDLDLSTRVMTDIEKVQFTKEYKRAYQVGRDKRMQKILTAKKPSAYRERK